MFHVASLRFTAGALTLFALAAVIVAEAQTPACPWDASCISWTPPTAYTTGEALPLSAIASYRIEAATASAGPWTALATVPAPTTTYQRRPVSGTNYYRVVAVLVGGPISAPGLSNPDATTQPAPNPPIVTVAGTGYRLDLGYYNQIKIAAIGLVPVGAPCLSFTAQGLNLIDRRLLKPDPGKSTPKQVLAKCGTAM